MKHNQSSLPNLLDMNASEIEALGTPLGWPRYRTTQVLKWLYQKGVSHISEMTNLSKDDRDRLQGVATISRMACSVSEMAGDGTGKFLGKLDDGLAVETVMIPEGHRRTVCVSSQVGCTLDCGFCLTAQIGFRRNLSPHEIVDQVWHARKSLGQGEAITSLVFMGMGEPLLNFEAVAEAIQRLTNAEWGMVMSPRRITVSTAGWVPRFQDIQRLGVNLAISLNATTNHQRQLLMPAVNKRFDLMQIMEASRAYAKRSDRRLTFEYVLIARVNDSVEDAKRLVKLLRGIRCKINLIPFNEFSGSSYQRPSQEVIEVFQQTVRNGGYDVYLRRSRGVDVLGACGQLGRMASEAAHIVPKGLRKGSANARS
ncbi:MAG: 23S rRNA (adenine(2503)-C(2))-methyltransferase RlmN [Nitrospirales bacterium]|nr:23S rRNA (adenine(2503)-C(2))-methyltransferase RlmN [Nitrospirales bacterium]